MEPRYDPDWGNPEEADEFVGHIGELDVWANVTRYTEKWIYVIGPPKRHLRRRPNFNGYRIDGNLLVIDGEDDINVTPYELGRLYEIAMEKGLIQ